MTIETPCGILVFPRLDRPHAVNVMGHTSPLRFTAVLLFDDFPLELCLPEDGVCRLTSLKPLSDRDRKRLKPYDSARWKLHVSAPENRPPMLVSRFGLHQRDINGHSGPVFADGDRVCFGIEELPYPIPGADGERREGIAAILRYVKECAG